MDDRPNTWTHELERGDQPLRLNAWTQIGYMGRHIDRQVKNVKTTKKTSTKATEATEATKPQSQVGKHEDN